MWIALSQVDSQYTGIQGFGCGHASLGPRHGRNDRFDVSFWYDIALFLSEVESGINY